MKFKKKLLSIFLIIPITLYSMEKRPADNLFKKPVERPKRIKIDDSQKPTTNQLLEETNIPTKLLLEGHTDTIWAVDYDPLSQIVISGSHDKTVKLWNAYNGSFIKTFITHTQPILSLHFDCVNRQLIIGDTAKNVTVYDLKSKKAFVLRGHKGPVFAVVHDPFTNFVISGSTDTTIKIWNPQNCLCVKTLSGHTASIYALCIDPSSNYLFSAAADHTVKVWDLTTDTCIQTLPQECSITSLCYNEREGCIYVGGSNGIIKLLDPQTGDPIAVLQGHKDQITSLYYSYSRNILISGSKDKSIIVWDLGTGNHKHIIAKSPVNTLSYAKHSERIIYSNGEKSLILYKI